MGTYENLRLEIRDRIATVTLDRPPVNALSTALYRDITGVFEEVNQRVDEIDAAILTGAGRCFCAGRDLKLAETDSQEVRAAASRAGLSAVYHCAVPLISAVNGPAMGAGFAFALLSDFIVCAPTAVFAFPEIDANVNPSVAILLRAFNQFQARALAFTGQRVGPEELQRLGVVRAVVPAERLLVEAGDLAALLSTKRAAALRAAKWSANEVELLLGDFEAAHRSIESPVSNAIQHALRLERQAAEA
ncbi:MAG TPA: enoyl-CoA hydratase-related protein [Rugosimonospora sp.]|nr:enoyl-CoA hydratase-related protein [Rugosimonospora sp.]